METGRTDMSPLPPPPPLSVPHRPFHMDGRTRTDARSPRVFFFTPPLLSMYEFRRNGRHPVRTGALEHWDTGATGIGFATTTRCWYTEVGICSHQCVLCSARLDCLLWSGLKDERSRWALGWGGSEGGRGGGGRCTRFVLFMGMMECWPGRRSWRGEDFFFVSFLHH